jgi:hypothetical protein
VNFGIGSEKLSGKSPPDLNPICHDLSCICFPVRNRVFVVVDWRRHSSEKSRRINFSSGEACVRGGALGEFAVNELAFIEFRSPEIASIECTHLKRHLMKESSPEHATLEITILKC